MPDRDPRQARTLNEASLNADGETYNGARALSWLSGVLAGGDDRGLSENEVKDLFDKVRTDKGLDRAKRQQGVGG